MHPIGWKSNQPQNVTEAVRNPSATSLHMSPASPAVNLPVPSKQLWHRRAMLSDTWTAHAPNWLEVEPSHGGGKEPKCNKLAHVSSFLRSESTRPFQAALAPWSHAVRHVDGTCTPLVGIRTNSHEFAGQAQTVTEAVRNPSATSLHMSPASPAVNLPVPSQHS